MPWDAGCKVLMLAPAGLGPAMTGLQAGMLQQCLHGFASFCDVLVRGLITPAIRLTFCSQLVEALIDGAVLSHTVL